MADWEIPGNVNDIIISTNSQASIGGGLASYGNMSTTATWPVANRAICVPFRVFYPYTAVKMMMRNVATSTGNRDIGIYDDQGNLLVNMGSTAAGSVNSIQSFDIADTTLLPGTYYAALVCASASNVQDGWTMGTNGAGLAAAWGVFEIAATALPLPNPATFVSATGLFVPFIGMTSRVLV